MSILRRLSRQVTAGTIQRPLGPTFDWNLLGSVAAEQLMSHPAEDAPFFRWADVEIERPCLVRLPGLEITHCVWGHEIDHEKTVLESSTLITPGRCVAASTPALKLLKLFRDDPQPWRLVLGENGLSGVVSRDDIFRPEMAVCVLALLLDVEQRSAERACWEPGHADQAWARLSEGRRTKAELIWQKRHRKREQPPEPEELIFCTTFADKAALVATLPPFEDLSKRELERRFSLMERMRNNLAHTSMFIGGDLSEMERAVSYAEDVLRRLAPGDSGPLRLVVSNAP